MKPQAEINVKALIAWRKYPNHKAFYKNCFKYSIHSVSI